VRRTRWRRRLLVSVAGVVVLALLVGVGGLLYARFRYDQVKKVAVGGLKVQTKNDPMNILLIGNNSRCVLNGKQTSAFGFCSTHGGPRSVGGGRSDVTMVLHVNPATHHLALLSIPRDLFLPIPGHSDNRIDSALDFGPTELVAAIQQDLGIPITHFVELNFDTFQKVVSTLGGVDVYFPDPVKDAYSGLNVPVAGCHHLDGFQSLALVRARHMYYFQGGSWHYDPTGDLGRIKRDHEFLRVLAAEVLHQGLGNPLKLNAIVGNVAPDLEVDRSFSETEMFDLVRAFHGVDPSSIPTSTLPVIIANNYRFNGTNYGDVVLPAAPFDNQDIAQFMGTTVDTNPSLAPSSVSVQVLNGSGASGQAAQVSSELRALGYDVVGTGNTKVLGPKLETLVYYRSGDLAQGEKVLSDLSGAAILGQMPTQMASSTSASVVLVTGTSFAVDSPASSASTSSTSSSVPTTTTTSIPASAFQAGLATLEHTSLPAFDPRACPKGMPVTPL
jgi:LCP family protein required for cell wall assembly